MFVLCLLFFEFFRIALFTIGGGLVMIPIIENTFVKRRHLLKESDIMDMVGITQTIPGLIAINSACFVGYKLAGIRGSLVATMGVILPSMMIIMLIAGLFPLENLSNMRLLQAFQCVRACVLGMFLVLAYRVGKNLIKSIKDIPLLLVLLCLLSCGFNVVFTIVITCLLGGLYETYGRQGEKK